MNISEEGLQSNSKLVTDSEAKKRYVIGIDIDDTINDLSSILVKYAIEYNQQTNIEHDIQAHEWEFEKAFGWDSENIKEFLEKYLYKAYIEAIPKENSVEVIKRLKEEGNKIIIITSRSDEEVKNSHYYSEQWLKSYGIPYDKLVLNSVDKAAKCIENNIDIFIDDRISHCKNVSRNARIPVYLFDSAYNKNHEDTGMKRVFSWLEVYNEIKKL